MERATCSPRKAFIKANVSAFAEKNAPSGSELTGGKPARKPVISEKAERITFPCLFVGVDSEREETTAFRLKL